MASAELNAELCCSLCQNIYTDPVTLRCGHNFCRGCMEIELKDQDEVGSYTCPTCGKKFSSRPSLQENRELSNRVEREQSARENSTVLCMNCSAPAVKTCVQCFGSVCGKHLSEHKSHRLIDPTSLEDKKCRAHLRLRDYYCTEDSTCICSHCFVVGDHKGHSVEPLEEASKKEKETPSRTEEQRRDLNGHSVQDDVSEDKPCNGHTDQTDVKDAVHKHQDSTVVKMDPVITEGTYRLDAKSAGLLQCSKSKLQLLVNSPLVIDFTMVKNWDNLMPDTYKNKYEIRSPLFNINTSAPHEISAVYLPHSLCPKEFKNKQAIP
ncbi:E3 ubiquitin/ISG15 ligase TRIM25-like isoform X1 [Aquarana catesbeiana]|uniref:E3 ubiquitin/ISG15 ligase TRIM25-like isoform X1 n=1 Tax=Aquarana catesbeiana TaxID=8400 RepID=UPI003CC9EC7B